MSEITSEDAKRKTSNVIRSEKLSQITLDEAKKLAESVENGKAVSYVDAAFVLSRFVLGLQSVRPVMPKDEYKTCCSVSAIEECRADCIAKKG